MSDLEALQAELADLKDRFMEQADRAASSRDSIVRLRERLRELRDLTEQQRLKIANMKRSAEDRDREHQSFIDGLYHGQQRLFGEVLQRLVERSEYVGGLGAEMSALEGRLEKLESVAVDVPKGTGEGH